jgi:hypothetical protein
LPDTWENTGLAGFGLAQDASFDGAGGGGVAEAGGAELGGAELAGAEAGGAEFGGTERGEPPQAAAAPTVSNPVTIAAAGRPHLGFTNVDAIPAGTAETSLLLSSC